MKLNIQWTSPAVAPECGFRVQYRQKGASSYSVLSASGTVNSSGITSVDLPVTEEGSYEGLVQSNCCDGDYSTGVAFGTNTYNPVTVSIAEYPLNGRVYYRARIQSAFQNPWPVYITGSFKETCASGQRDIPFTLIYTAGYTDLYQFITDNAENPVIATCSGASLSALVVDNISVDFPRSSEVQIFDTVNTPKYTQPYWNEIPEWNGSPVYLPSFSIDLFTPQSSTEGVLRISWIMDEKFMNAVAPYDTVIIDIYDGAERIGSSNPINMSRMGLLNENITLTKDTQDFDENAVFTIHARLPNLDDEYIGDAKNMVLP